MGQGLEAVRQAAARRGWCLNLVAVRGGFGRGCPVRRFFKGESMRDDDVPSFFKVASGVYAMLLAIVVVSIQFDTSRLNRDREEMHDRLDKLFERADAVAKSQAEMVKQNRNPKDAPEQIMEVAEHVPYVPKSLPAVPPDGKQFDARVLRCAACHDAAFAEKFGLFDLASDSTWLK
jgi:hypothetical protein